METGTIGGASEFYFKELKNRHLRGYNAVQSKPVGSKVDRAAPLRDAILDGKVIVNVNDEARAKLIEQLKAFPLGKHDDIIDAMSYAYNELSKGQNTPAMSSRNKRKRIQLNEHYR